MSACASSRRSSTSSSARCSASRARLPLLSTALLELWERRDGRLIRAEAYGADGRRPRRGRAAGRGRLRRLRRRAAGDRAQRPAPARRRRRGAGRRAPPRSAGRVRRRAERAGRATCSTSSTTRRLLTVSEGSVEVAHEALLREWPRFQDWLEEDREGRRLHAHLMETAREWADRGRDSADLYRGARLSSALDWTTEHTLDLNEIGARVRQREPRRERARADAADASRTGGCAVRSSASASLLVLAIAAGAVALVARSNAQHSATAAVAQRLGAQALVAKDLDLSLLLGRQGVALDDSLPTRGNLEAALIRSPAAIRVARPLPGRYLNVSTLTRRSLLAVGRTARRSRSSTGRPSRRPRDVKQRAVARSGRLHDGRQADRLPAHRAAGVRRRRPGDRGRAQPVLVTPERGSSTSRSRRRSTTGRRPRRQKRQDDADRMVVSGEEARCSARSTPGLPVSDLETSGRSAARLQEQRPDESGCVAAADRHRGLVVPSLAASGRRCPADDGTSVRDRPRRDGSSSLGHIDGSVTVTDLRDGQDADAQRTSQRRRARRRLQPRRPDDRLDRGRQAGARLGRTVRAA